MKEILTILISYLIGCFSSAYFLGKISKNIDIRCYGSGNAGATNALRILGIKIGVLTLILDVIKGMIAVYIGNMILGFNGQLLSSIFVVIGHNWPVFLRFKGGKGVATSLGAILMLNWKAGLLCLLIAIIVILITKYVSLGSIIASASAPIIMLLVSHDKNKYLYITITFLALLSICRHKANIIRLYNRQESKIGNKI